MKTKPLCLCLLAAAAACPSLALADTTFDAAQLGRMQGILSACSRVSPRQASNYLLQIKAFIGDASKESVDQAARTDEYQQAYQAVTNELRAMEKEDRERACASYFAAAK